MLLRSAVDDLDKSIDTFRGCGIDQIVISTLDFLPSESLAGEAFTDEGELTSVEGRLEALVERGRETGLDIHYYLGSSGLNEGYCGENVERSFFVASDGAVSPCVYTSLPIQAGLAIEESNALPSRRLSFGNLHEETPSAIWNRKTYKGFRRSFPSGPLHACCQGCAKLQRIPAAEELPLLDSLLVR